jgi:adenosylcobinamide kinase/adenosylcobinamide-phosphate guanylyltransferase
MAILVTGGARSGKSSFAEQYALRSAEKGIYIATCQPYDKEMRERIGKHQQMRLDSGFTWETLEEPYDTAALLTQLAARRMPENSTGEKHLEIAALANVEKGEDIEESAKLAAAERSASAGEIAILADMKRSTGTGDATKLAAAERSASTGETAILADMKRSTGTGDATKLADEERSASTEESAILAEVKRTGSMGETVDKALTNDKPPVVLLDCLTLWLTNWMLRTEQEERADELLEAEIERLLAAIEAYPHTLIIVTNEVGAGIVPEYPLGRRFRDEAGRLNQRVAALCERVFLVTAGIPVELKSQAFKWEQL